MVMHMFYNLFARPSLRRTMVSIFSSRVAHHLGFVLIQCCISSGHLQASPLRASIEASVQMYSALLRGVFGTGDEIQISPAFKKTGVFHGSFGQMFPDFLVEYEIGDRVQFSLRFGYPTSVSECLFNLGVSVYGHVDESCVRRQPYTGS